MNTVYVDVGELPIDMFVDVFKWLIDNSIPFKFVNYSDNADETEFVERIELDEQDAIVLKIKFMQHAHIL